MRRARPRLTVKYKCVAWGASACDGSSRKAAFRASGTRRKRPSPISGGNIMTATRQCSRGTASWRGNKVAFEAHGAFGLLIEHERSLQPKGR